MRKQITVVLIGLVLFKSASAQTCLVPTQEFAKELKTFLIDGADFGKMAAVKSQSHKNMYYVTVELEVPGASGRALCAANKIDGFGMFYAVDEIANEFSSLIDGRQTDGEFSAGDPAARRARECLN